MDLEKINFWLNKFREIKSQRNGDQIAPHKPLLLLYYLGRIWQNQNTERLLAFSEIQSDLTDLLKRYSFSKNKQTPENPFVRLCGDGFWDYQGPTFNPSLNVPSATALNKAGAKAGFYLNLYEDLCKTPLLISTLAEEILAQNFAESLHLDLLDSVGLTYRYDTPGLVVDQRKKRNPEFRKLVSAAYENRCAVCKTSLRIDLNPVALEAAHIQWHAHQGPDQVNNGLLLCSIHHKLLDLGAYTVNHDLKVVVSHTVESHQVGFDYWLGNFHHQEIVQTRNAEQSPDPKFLTWHAKNIFRH